MKFIVVILVTFPLLALSTTLKVGLYDNHDEYLQYSKAYKLNWLIFIEAADELELNLQARPYVWLRALSFIEEKELDVLVGAYYTKQRHRFAHYSLPLSIDYVYLYVNRQRLFNAPIDYKNGIIGVTSKSIGDDLAKQLGFNNIYEKSASEQVFRLLRNNRFDYAIFSESVAAKHCHVNTSENQTSDCITPKKPALLTNSFHTIYSRTSRNINLAQQLDLIVEKMRISGRLRELHREAGYAEKDYQLLINQMRKWPLK